jgi:hypothetical protein
MTAQQRTRYEMTRAATIELYYQILKYAVNRIKDLDNIDNFHQDNVIGIYYLYVDPAAGDTQR